MEEVCGKSIPQLEQGSKRACGVKVRSPAVFSVSGLTSLDSPPVGAGGGVALLPHAGVFRLNQALLKTGFLNFFGSVKYFMSEL